MSLASLVTLLVAIAKAMPALSELADKFGEAWREHRRTQAHARIKDAVAAAQALPWECPPRCPHRLLHAHPPSESGGCAPEAP